jgi:hypothetical protein
MLNKKNLVVATLATLAAGLLVVTQTAGSKPNQQANKLEGAWIAKVPGMPIQWSYVMSPADPSGKRAALSSTLHVRIPGEVWFPDLVPPVDYFTPFAGEAVMTGPDTARFTGVGYGIKKVVPSESYPFWEQVVLICVTSGEIQFTAPGKVETTHHIADYLPAADADGDGLPDAGQTPFLCLPPTTTLDTRVGLMPLCSAQ